MNTEQFSLRCGKRNKVDGDLRAPLLARADKTRPEVAFHLSSHILMKLPAAVFALVAAFFALTGCGNLDLASESDPNRVLTGAVKFGAALPAGAQVMVRIVDLSNREPARPANQELPLTVADRSRAMPVERVLGEQLQTLSGTAIESVPFRIEYRADDMTLRHGVNVDVRISYDGKVRYRTIRAHALTLRSAQFPQEVEVQAVQ